MSGEIFEVKQIRSINASGIAVAASRGAAAACSTSSLAGDVATYVHASGVARSRWRGAVVQHQADVCLLGCGCWRFNALVPGDIYADQRGFFGGQISGCRIGIDVVDDVRDVVDLQIETADQIAVFEHLARDIREQL